MRNHSESIIKELDEALKLQHNAMFQLVWSGLPMRTLELLRIWVASCCQEQSLSLQGSDFSLALPLGRWEYTVAAIVWVGSWEYTVASSS